MSDRIKNIRQHLKNQKTKYLVAGGVVFGVVVGGTIVYLKISSINVTNAASATVSDIAENATVNIDQSMTTIIELVRRGHPGYKILCNETGEQFASIRRAAKVIGVNPGNLSKHLNGDIPHVGGFTFENLGEMQ